MGLRIRGRELEDATHVRESPGIDRLVVITDHEKVVLGSSEEPDQAELGGVDILEFIDAHMTETLLPAHAEAWVGGEPIRRADHEIVEVGGMPRCEEGVIGGQHRLGFGRGRAALHFPCGEPGVERCHIR